MAIVDKITSGSAVILAIIAIVMSSGLIGQEEVYVCEDTQLAIQCDSLSAANGEGLRTRCYFNDGTKDTYKVCSGGWIKYTPGEEKDINLTNLEHIYLLCEKNNEIISLCQVIDKNETIYRIE